MDVPLYGLGFAGPMMFVVFDTWLDNRTGSVLPCILLHASFTPSREPPPVFPQTPSGLAPMTVATARAKLVPNREGEQP